MFRLLILVAFWFGVPIMAYCQVPELSSDDLVWINRITWGINLPAAQEYQHLGRAAWTEKQLTWQGDDALPPAIRDRIAAMPVSQTSLARLLSERRAAQQAIQKMSNPEQIATQRKQLNQQANQLVQQDIERNLLRDLYAENQLEQVMSWFWFNHFNVFRHKGLDELMVADYMETAIRPHALGQFSDLVWATLTHPAMLFYLDNQQNAVGHSNENYARELMELHTLGVNGGYTQADVQALAGILTGLDFRLPGQCLPGQNVLPDVPVQDINPLFCYGPARHDNSARIFLGHTFPANGGRENVVKAVNLLIHSPATAHHVCLEMAVYLLGDQPPAEVVDAMATMFENTDGNIASTLRVLFDSPAFLSQRNRQFKDPQRYVLSAVRLLYGNDPVQNLRPLIGGLHQLGEPPYEHISPDGYPLSGSAWMSADQISKRVDLAQKLFQSAGVLFTDENIADPQTQEDRQKLQQLRRAAWEANQPQAFAIEELIRPMLSGQTRQALDQSRSTQEWTGLLLASPEFMYR